MGRRGADAWIGACLIAAGGLTFAINAALTPLLPEDGEVLAAASPIFLARQAASAAAAALLLVAAAGLLFRPIQGAPRWAGAAATLAVLGSAALFAQEWGEVFVIHTFARLEPAALTRMDGAAGVSAYDAGALAAFCTFTAGWIAVAAAGLRTAGQGRRAPWLIIGGFFAVPLLAALAGPIIGAAVGNAILGAGWILFGIERRRPG